MAEPTTDRDPREDQVHGNSGPGGPLRDWWRREWDFILLWSAVFVIGMLGAGALSATLEAIQHAVAYH